MFERQFSGSMEREHANLPSAEEALRDYFPTNKDQDQRNFTEVLSMLNEPETES